MEGLIPFFIVLLVSLLSSRLVRRFHVPWAVGLIVAGIIIGPSVFGIFTPDATIEFLGEIGLIFLMFMAGLEIKLSSFKSLGKTTASVAVLNGGIPFIVGILIGQIFGFGLTASLLLGVIFISSSVALIVPLLEQKNILKEPIGKIIVGSSVIEDVASLVILSVLLQNISPQTFLPLPLFYILVVVVVFVLRIVIIRMHKIFSFTSNNNNVFQGELRSIFAILVGTVIVFEFLGLHPIIASFFAGLILSESVSGDVLREKLRLVSYGIFIPVFFIVIGTQANISVFAKVSSALALTVTVVLGSIIFKLLSGYYAGRVNKLSVKDSLLLGTTKIPQLTTTLAVTFIGLELGILNEQIATAMIVLSIVTTIASPILVKIVTPNKKLQLSLFDEPLHKVSQIKLN